MSNSVLLAQAADQRCAWSLATSTKGTGLPVGAFVPAAASDAFARPRPEGHGHTSGASLDHAMWFHRPFHADRWLLYAQDSPVAVGARGLARGEVFTQEGDLVVSVVQEGLIRITP